MNDDRGSRFSFSRSSTRGSLLSRQGSKAKPEPPSSTPSTSVPTSIATDAPSGWSFGSRPSIATSLRRGKGSNDPATQILLHLARLLKEFTFFADLDKDVQTNLPDIVSYDSETKGTILFRQGDPPGRCYILLTGAVEVWKDDMEDNQAPRGGRHHGGAHGGGAHHGDAHHGGAHDGEAHHGKAHHGGAHHGDAHHGGPHHGGAHHKGTRNTHHGGAHHGGPPQVDTQGGSPQGGALGAADGDNQSEPPSPGSPKIARRFGVLPKTVPFVAGTPIMMRKCKAMADMLASMSIEGIGALLSPAAGNSPMWMSSPGRPFLPNSPGSNNSQCSPRSSEELGDWDTHIAGHPVAYLGPGMLFGELALIEDQPRNASIRCKENCEFLVIERLNFEAVLKAGMLRAHAAKIDFLRHHVPGYRELSSRKAEDTSYLFKKVSFAKNHMFSTQGGVTNGIINVVIKGAVELTLCSTPNIPVFDGLPEIGRRRLGVLVTGGIFGSFHLNRHDPFNVVASTSPCDVYQLTREDYRRLPECVLHGIRDVVDRGTQFRLLRCDSPAELAGIMNKGKKPVGFGNKRKPWREKTVVAWPDFTNNDAGAVEFDLAPGECIAMTGKQPHLRKLTVSTHARSMPNLRRPNTGEAKVRSRTALRASSQADESTYLGI